MNSQQFTAELNDTLGNRLTLRPYNRFEPQSTIWWLVPSTEWPAFKFTKLFVNPMKDSDRFQVGIYLEKGHGSDILTVSGDTAGNRAQVMDSFWAWTKFSIIDTGYLESALIDLKDADIKLKLKLEFEPYNTQRSNPDSLEAMQPTTVYYDCDGSSVDIVDAENSINDKDLKNLIDRLPTHGTIKDIFNSVNEFEESKWYWINLLLYFETDVISTKVTTTIGKYLPLVE